MQRKILLDECVDRNLASHIVGHQVTNVREEGWSSLTNGKLLTLAQNRFDVFLTIDQNLIHQQNLAKYDIVVVVFKTPSSDLEELVKFVPELLNTLQRPHIASPLVLDFP